MEINFSLLEKEIFSLLGDKKIMILATSYEDKVTARSMSCVIINRKIYCQTDKTFLKYNQMAKNPNVALCVDNIQIEGIAKIKHIEKSMIPLFSYGGIFLFRNSNKPASTFRYRLFSFICIGKNYIIILMHKVIFVIYYEENLY